VQTTIGHFGATSSSSQWNEWKSFVIEKQALQTTSTDAEIEIGIGLCTTQCKD
jgi:hypothetical protein